MEKDSIRTVKKTYDFKRMILNFRVYGQRLRRLDNNYIVDLSKEYLQCNFTYSDDWTGLTKYATFSVKGRHYRFKIEDDIVRVPNDVLKYKYFYLEVNGVSGDGKEIITTDTLIIIMKISGYTEHLTPSCDDEVIDVYTVLKEKLKTKIDDIKIEDNNLVCYSEKTIVKIVPLPFIDNYYDKSEIDEMFNRTFIDVDTSELSSDGYLIFERYNL